jgi:hypothetical protein
MHRFDAFVEHDEQTLHSDDQPKIGGDGRPLQRDCMCLGFDSLSCGDGVVSIDDYASAPPLEGHFARRRGIWRVRGLLRLLFCDCLGTPVLV